jgi:hypothetical protein
MKHLKLLIGCSIQQHPDMSDAMHQDQLTCTQQHHKLFGIMPATGIDMHADTCT